jgi:hypothetical protein
LKPWSPRSERGDFFLPPGSSGILGRLRYLVAGKSDREQAAEAGVDEN